MEMVVPTYKWIHIFVAQRSLAPYRYCLVKVTTLWKTRAHFPLISFVSIFIWTSLTLVPLYSEHLYRSRRYKFQMFLLRSTVPKLCMVSENAMITHIVRAANTLNWFNVFSIFNVRSCSCVLQVPTYNISKYLIKAHKR